MKIAWFCIPAHGHTNPTLALVKELTDAGHEVFYFSFEAFREKIERAGAVFIGCDSYEFEMEDGGNADRVGKDLVYSTELMVSSTLALDEMASEKIREIQPDLIVSDSVAHWGKLNAIKHNIPFVSSTTTFAFNQHSSRYMKQSLGSLVKMLFSMPKINKQLRRLQDKGYPVKSIIEIVQNDNDTNTIVYTSKHYQPCAETFSEKYHFIGPSLRPIETPMEKTAEKTVYISMGTVVKNEAFYRNCVEAFRDLPYQVILSLGTNAVDLGDLPPHIQVYDSVDQMAVLDIADVFITHCGMNSASEGLYFEVPLVLVPQTPEQGAVAIRTEELGAGIRLTDTQPDSIRKAVEQLLNDPGYKEAAKQISQSFKSCGGTAEARAFLESLAKKAAFE